MDRRVAIQHWQAVHDCVLPARTLAFVHSVKNELRLAAMVSSPVCCRVSVNSGTPYFWREARYR